MHGIEEFSYGTKGDQIPLYVASDEEVINESANQ